MRIPIAKDLNMTDEEQEKEQKRSLELLNAWLMDLCGRGMKTQPETEPVMKKTKSPVSWYYPLLHHMFTEHRLTLLESEMADIIVVVDKMMEKNAKGCASQSPKVGAEVQLEWLWANCKIVHWPRREQGSGDGYPIEHNPYAKKYSRELIEAEMPSAS